MKAQYLSIPAIFLLWTTPAQACMQGIFEAIIIAFVAVLTTILLTSASQSGLMHLRRRHTLSGLGRWTLTGLSTVHLLVGLGILLIGLGGGPGGALIGFLIALPLLLLGRAGLKQPR